MANDRTHEPGFFQRALQRRRRRPLADPLEQELEAQLDWSDSPRERIADAGELASGGFVRVPWGWGVGTGGGSHDYTSGHAATIRSCASLIATLAT